VRPLNLAPRLAKECIPVLAQFPVQNILLHRARDPGHNCRTLDLVFALSGLGDGHGDGDGGDDFPDQDEDALGAQGWLTVIRE
jgi:hypothetical protein